MYFVTAAWFGAPLVSKSAPGPAIAPAWAKPAVVGGRKCVATSPTIGPPRVSCSCVLSVAAETALRRLMLLNGGIFVLNAMYRLPYGVNVIWSLNCWAAFLTIGAGGESPLIESVPVRIWLPATAGSFPIDQSIWST